MVRIADARISGRSYGLMIVHVAPEAAVRGPIGAVETGDVIDLDVHGGHVDLEVEAHEIKRRLAARPAHEPSYPRG